MIDLRKRFCLGVVLIASTVSSCASSTVKREETFVAANNQTILFETENALGVSRARIAYLRNNSTVPVTVTYVNVMDCQNVKQYCGMNKKAVQVPAGQRREIIRLEPDNRNNVFNYRLLYQWQPQGNRKGALTALAEAGDSSSVRRLAAITRAEELSKADAKSGDKILYSNTLQQLGHTFVGLRADPDTVQMTVGSRLFIYEQLRVLAVDKEGKSLGRVRGALTWSVPRSTAFRFMPSDTLEAVAPGTMTITMRMTAGAMTDTAHARTIAPVKFTIIAK